MLKVVGVCNHCGADLKGLDECGACGWTTSIPRRRMSGALVFPAFLLLVFVGYLLVLLVVGTGSLLAIALAVVGWAFLIAAAMWTSDLDWRDR